MATTAFGVNHPLARKLWSEKLFRESMSQTYLQRFSGTSSNSAVQILTDAQKGAGDTVYTGLRMLLSGSGVSGDNTLEGNEEAMTFHRDGVVLDQLRNAVRSAGKMTEQRVPYSMRAEANEALSQWLADRVDTAWLNVVTGNTAETDTNKTGGSTCTAPTRTIMGGGSESTEASLSATTTQMLTLRDIDRCVAIAKTQSPRINPINVGGKQYYLMMIHPYQTYLLRGQTSAGQWADIQRALIEGGNMEKSGIFDGALGVYNNVVIHESDRIPITVSNAANTSFRRSVFLGAQSAIMAFGQNGSGLRAQYNEEMFDYGNQLGVSAGLIWGIKKSVFNSQDFAAIVVSAYAPAVS